MTPTPAEPESQGPGSGSIHSALEVLAATPSALRRSRASDLAAGDEARLKQLLRFIPFLDDADEEEERAAAQGPSRSAATSWDPAGGTSAAINALLEGFEPKTQDGSILPAGFRIGRYTVTRLIAASGMSYVYEALQDQPRQTVAIKTIHGGVLSNELWRRFEFESTILANLSHRAIARVFEVGRYAGGERDVPYIVIEFVQGARSLCLYADEENLTINEKLDLFAEVCDAVHHAHRRGVVHKDIKPDNVLVSRAGHPKVIDFGVAAAEVLESAHPDIAAAGPMRAGTIAYMSPQQVTGRGDVSDVRSDIYSLGVLLFELLTGQRPIDISGLKPDQALERVRTQTPRRLRQVDRKLSADLDAIVAKALEREPRSRYQWASDLRDDVRAVIEGRSPPIARPRVVLGQTRRFVRSHPVIAVQVVVVLLLAAVLPQVTGGLTPDLRELQSLKDAMQLDLQNASAENEALRADLDALDSLNIMLSEEQVELHAASIRAAAEAAGPEESQRRAQDITREILDCFGVDPALPSTDDRRWLRKRLSLARVLDALAEELAGYDTVRPAAVGYAALAVSAFEQANGPDAARLGEQASWQELRARVRYATLSPSPGDAVAVLQAARDRFAIQRRSPAQPGSADHAAADSSGPDASSSDAGAGTSPAIDGSPRSAAAQIPWNLELARMYLVWAEREIENRGMRQTDPCELLTLAERELQATQGPEADTVRRRVADARSRACGGAADSPG